MSGWRLKLASCATAAIRRHTELAAEELLQRPKRTSPVSKAEHKADSAAVRLKALSVLLDGIGSSDIKLTRNSQDYPGV
jgi:hypothetical protein